MLRVRGRDSGGRQRGADRVQEHAAEAAAVVGAEDGVPHRQRSQLRHIKIKLSTTGHAAQVSWTRNSSQDAQPRPGPGTPARVWIN